MATDVNVLAIATDPNNSGEAILYSISGGWWRGIPSGAFQDDLERRGIEAYGISAEVFDSLTQLGAE